METKVHDFLSTEINGEQLRPPSNSRASSPDMQMSHPISESSSPNKAFKMASDCNLIRHPKPEPLNWESVRDNSYYYF